MVEREKDNWLLPDLHPQGDLFICDVADAVLKDDMASMEHPFFSLSKTPDTRIRRYESGEKWLEVTPSVKGLATIYDKDILIYCISQLIAKLNRKEPVGRRVKIMTHELLFFINRKAGGTQYEMIREALIRLKGTIISTNIPTGQTMTERGFGLIEEYELNRSKLGQVISMEITLSQWVFNAIQGREVLTLHRDYFRLKKPLERRVYEIARKHCGQQDEWKIGLPQLKNKCGSRGSLKEFSRMIRELTQGDHLPDYSVRLDEETDNVVFRNRQICQPKPEIRYPVLTTETYHDARTVAPSYDVYVLEQQWHDWWVDSGMPQLHDPDKAFIGFCRKRYQQKPNP